MTDRRAFLTAALVAPVATAAPAVAQTLVCSTVDPVPEYLAAFHAYDEFDAASAERHRAARDALYDWVPDTAEGMLRKIVATLDDHGAAPETSLPALIRQVDQLIVDVA